METAVKKLYEAMFLVDSAQASDWDAVEKTIKTIMKRAQAEIVSIRNWAERKLAYEINSKSRGTYVLCYFRADGERVRSIEKDVQLSEQIMRVLVLSAETREKEALEESTPEPESEARKVGDESAPAKEEGKTGELQKSVEPAAVDVIEPEQPVETEAVDVIEPQKPAESEPADVSESEQAEKKEMEKDTSV